MKFAPYCCSTPLSFVQRTTLVLFIHGHYRFPTPRQFGKKCQVSCGPIDIHRPICYDDDGQSILLIRRDSLTFIISSARRTTPGYSFSRYRRSNLAHKRTHGPHRPALSDIDIVRFLAAEKRKCSFTAFCRSYTP
jgi:hypothetical protein